MTVVEKYTCIRRRPFHSFIVEESNTIRFPQIDIGSIAEKTVFGHERVGRGRWTTRVHVMAIDIRVIDVNSAEASGR